MKSKLRRIAIKKLKTRNLIGLVPKFLINVGLEKTINMNHFQIVIKWFDFLIKNKNYLK